MSVLERGLIQVYTGDGKGKTTAALGLAWRMLGRGGQVYLCQFLKPPDLVTGEALFAVNLSKNLVYDQLDQPWELRVGDPSEATVASLRQAISRKLQELIPIVHSRDYDLVILDELVYCLSRGFVDQAVLDELLAAKAPSVEIVMTGRGADESLMARADLVTVMQAHCHPYCKGVLAREGIEY